MTKKCEQCGIADIDEKYKICQKCHNENLAEKKNENGAILKELGAINNNLYFLRRAMAIQLKQQFGKTIIWDKEKKDFIEK